MSPDHQAEAKELGRHPSRDELQETRFETGVRVDELEKSPSDHSETRRMPVYHSCFQDIRIDKHCVLIGAADIGDIDTLIDQCIRGDPDITNITVNFILSSAKDLILPLNFDIENAIDIGCGEIVS